MPTSTKEDIKTAMDAVLRLYDLREEYARAKAELNRLEDEMEHMKSYAWSVLNNIEQGMEKKGEPK